MLEKLIRLMEQGVPAPEYGVPTPDPMRITALYGVPVPLESPTRELFLSNLFLLLILIPIILLVGVFALAKKKQFSKKERIWAVAIVLSIYFIILIGAVIIKFV